MIHFILSRHPAGKDILNYIDKEVMNRKVLFVNHSLTGGGSEKAMSLIANYFASQGIEVEMLLLSEQPRTYKVDERIRIIECYCPIEGNKLVWHLRRIRTIRDSIKKSDAPVVITFMWDINMNVILACAGLGKRIITSERCDPHNEPRKLMWFAMHFVLPFADMTVFQTPMVQGYYPKSVQRRSTVIPNAISEDVPDPDRDPEKIRKEIVAVGRFTKQKNFELLIDAFSDIHGKYPEYKLIIYGDGPLRHEMEQQIRKLGLDNSVRLPGYVSDVNERMRYAAIFVNSSNYEGISNAMLEAMAMGLPCICTDCPVGGARMLIQDGVNGILVQVGNKDQLVSKISILLERNDFSKKIRESADSVRKKYATEHIGRMWMEKIDL